MSRNTVRSALRSVTAPRYSRPAAGSKLDPFKVEIHRLLRADPRMPGQRVRELIAPLGYAGGKTIVDDYLREVRPLFAPPRTFQRTIYRPDEICQFDLWEPKAEIPVGHGQTRKGWVVVACLGYSRAGAGALMPASGPRPPGPEHRHDGSTVPAAIANGHARERPDAAVPMQADGTPAEDERAIELDVLTACVLVIALGTLAFAQLDDPDPRRTPAGQRAPDAPGGYEVTHPPGRFPAQPGHTQPNSAAEAAAVQPSPTGPSRRRAAKRWA